VQFFPIIGFAAIDAAVLFPFLGGLGILVCLWSYGSVEHYCLCNVKLDRFVNFKWCGVFSALETFVKLHRTRRLILRLYKNCV